MIIEGGLDALNTLIKQQLINLFSCTEVEAKQVSDAMDHTLVRLEQNFEKNPNKYYKLEGGTYFNPFHSGQYCIFLYYLSNTIFRVMQKRALIADKIYYLNKALNSCDLYYEIDLPDYFTTDHPVGTVLGRATYGNGFSFGQNCTIGNNKGIFPILGENVRLCAMSAIIGNCTIGDNVTLGAGALVKDEDVPSNTIVFGSSPNLVLKSYV